MELFASYFKENVDVILYNSDNRLYPIGFS